MKNPLYLYIMSKLLDQIVNRKKKVIKFLCKNCILETKYHEFFTLLARVLSATKLRQQKCRATKKMEILLKNYNREKDQRKTKQINFVVTTSQLLYKKERRKESLRIGSKSYDCHTEI